MASLTLNKVKPSLADRYPNYTPQNWYLSIIKPQGNRFKHVVALRPLLAKPRPTTAEELEEIDKDSVEI